VTSSSAPKRWSSGGDGQPWSAGKSWGAVGISFFGSFAAVALSIAFLPPAIGVGLAILGYGGGGLVATVAGIWLLVIAFQEDVVQGLLCLFVPLYIVYYMFRDWERTWLPTVTYWIGTLAMFGCIGGFLGGSLIGAMIFGVPE
jgi:hypothetical protein